MPELPRDPFILNLEQLTGLSIRRVKLGHNLVNIYSHNKTGCSYSFKEIARLGVQLKD